MNNKEKILEELQNLKEEINELYKGGKKNGEEIISNFNKVPSLLKFVDHHLENRFSIALERFETLYRLNPKCFGDTVYMSLKSCISLIDKAIEYLKTEERFSNIMPSQKYYVKNQKLELLNDLDQIFKDAERSVLYYDLYMDHVLVAMLEDVNVEEIKLLLKKPSLKFKTYVDTLKKEKGLDINYKEIKNKIVHGRYCLVDSSVLWQIDGSINNKTMSGLTLTKIIDKITKQKIIKDLGEVWQKA